MADDNEIRFKIYVAWWFVPYCYALAFFSALFNMEPDPDKLNDIAKLAMRARRV